MGTSKLYRVALAAIVTAPIVAVPIAAWRLWTKRDGLREVLLLVGTYLPIAFGVTVGLHRMFTHNSFTPVRSVKIVFGLLGILSVQGPISSWVADHRWHHKFSDSFLDLHSPWRYGTSLWERIRGFIHSHVGWLFSDFKAPVERYAPDILHDPDIVLLDRLQVPIITLSLVIPWILGGWRGLLWAGLLRVGLVHHVTWSINSLTHLVGEQNYQTPARDQSRNIWWWILPLGEQWHNTHHAFASSAQQGSSFVADPSYAVIRLLELFGLVKKLRVPTKEQFEKKRRKESTES